MASRTWSQCFPACPPAAQVDLQAVATISRPFGLQQCEVLQVSWTVQCLIFGGWVGFQTGLGERIPARNANARRCSSERNSSARAAPPRLTDTRPVPVPF